MNTITRDDVKRAVFENIPDKQLFVFPMPIPANRCMDPNENLNLINDLEMDSIEIVDMVYNSCEQLGIREDKIDMDDYGRLETLRDVINVIYTSV